MPTVSVSRTIAAPQEQVWTALADIQNAVRWNRAWERIEFTSRRRQGAGTTFRAHTGEGRAFDFEVTHWAPPEYIAFAPVRDDSERYELTLESQTFLLRPAGDAETRVRLAASASARGIRGRFVGLLFWPGYQKQGLNSALDALQSLFEPPAEDEPAAGTGLPPPSD